MSTDVGCTVPYHCKSALTVQMMSMSQCTKRCTAGSTAVVYGRYALVLRQNGQRDKAAPRAKYEVQRTAAFVVGSGRQGLVYHGLA